MIRSLEGLRGFAATFVALFHLHLFGNYVPLIRNGDLFVDLFFVLSGFVMSSAYANRLNDGQQVGVFVIRRFGRLFPLLAASTFLFILAQNTRALGKLIMEHSGNGAAFTVPAEAYAPTWGELASTLTMTHALGVLDRLSINFVTWSISAEFWTYLLFAAICVVVPRPKRLFWFFLVGFLAYAITVWASIYRHDCLNVGGCMSLTYDFGYPRCVAGFMLGCLACEFRKQGRTGAMGIATAVVLLGLFAAVDHLHAAAFVFPLLFALLIWSVCGDNGLLSRFLSSELGIELGKRSYSIYMLHPVLLAMGFSWLVRRAGTSVPLQLVTIAAYLGVLYFVSGIAYQRFEDPMRRFFNERAARLEGRLVQVSR